MPAPKKSFWEQFPVIVGALTALLVAVASLLVAYKQLIGDDKAAEASTAAVPSQAAGSASPAPVPATAPSGGSGTGAAPVTAQPARAESSGSAAPSTGCEREGSLRSPPTDHGVTLDFINRSDRPVRIFWISQGGGRTEIPSVGGDIVPLPPGQHRAQPTQVSHIWVVADERGTCRRIVTAPATDSTFVYP